LWEIDVLSDGLAEELGATVVDGADPDDHLDGDDPFADVRPVEEVIAGG
jgi:hypothetical protein